MCLILDTNRYGDYLNPDNKDMAPVKQWVETKGRLVYSPTSSLERELKKHTKMKNLMEMYHRSGKAKIIALTSVEAKESKLANHTPKLKSNDPHIIALALVGNVKLLVSQDQKLGDDFKEIVSGNIYKTKAHTHLLNQHACR